MRRFLFPLLLSLGLAGSALLRADLIYDVDSSGNTTFTTFSQALNQAALDNVGPFSVTVRVRARGSFPPLDVNAATYALNPQPGAGLVLEAMPGYTPLFTGSGSTGVRVSGLAHVLLSGLRVSGSHSDSLRLEAAPYMIVQGLVLEGAAVSAITANSCPNLFLLDNQLAPATGAAVYLSNSADALVWSNSVDPNSAPSYGFVIQGSHRAWLDRNDGGGSEQAYNIFSSSNVTLSANVAIKRGGPSSRGLVLDNAPYTWVLKNLLVGQSYGVEALASTGCAFMQNTVWEHATAALRARSNCSPLLLRNNLWQGGFAFFLDGATEAGLDSDNQGFNFFASGQFGLGSSSYPSLGDWQVTGNDANSLVSDPNFVNSAGTLPADFKLTAASPMQGYGANLSTFYTSDYFLDALPAAPTPWDPGFHVESAPQASATLTPVLPTATATPTVSPSPSATPTPSFTASPVGSATITPSPSATFTTTLTPTVTPYPIQRDRVITYPNPYHPNSGLQNIVFDTADDASIKLFDMNSQLVIELLPANIQAGLGHAVWDGKDKDGRLVPSGLYFCVVKTNKATRFVRFTVLY
jgi:hypothetical protein